MNVVRALIVVRCKT